MILLYVVNVIFLGVITRVLMGREQQDHPSSPSIVVDELEKEECALCGMSETLAGDLKPAMGKGICWACRQTIVEQEGFEGQAFPPPRSQANAR